MILFSIHALNLEDNALYNLETLYLKLLSKIGVLWEGLVNDALRLILFCWMSLRKNILFCCKDKMKLNYIFWKTQCAFRNTIFHRKSIKILEFWATRSNIYLFYCSLHCVHILFCLLIFLAWYWLRDSKLFIYLCLIFSLYC